MPELDAGYYISKLRSCSRTLSNSAQRRVALENSGLKDFLAEIDEFDAGLNTFAAYLYSVLSDNTYRKGTTLRLALFVLFDYLISVGERALVRDEDFLDRLTNDEAKISWNDLFDLLPSTEKRDVKEELRQLSTPITTDSFAHGYALVIGVGGHLRAPANDAQRLASLLKDSNHCAYPTHQVRLLLDEAATASNIRDELQWLQSQTMSDSEASVIIYYSGHGFNQPYYHFIPHGYDQNRLNETAISGEDFTKAVKAIKAQKKLILLDACHAGGLIELGPGNEMIYASVPNELLGKLAEGEGTVVISSSKPEQKSWALEENTIFSQVFYEALKGQGTVGHDSFIRVMDIAIYLDRVVPERARLYGKEQQPILDAAKATNFVVSYSGRKTIPSDELISMGATQQVYQNAYLQLVMERRSASSEQQETLTDALLIKQRQITSLEQKLDIEWLVTWLDDRFSQMERQFATHDANQKQALQAIYRKLPTDQSTELAQLVNELRYQRLEQEQMKQTVEAVRLALMTDANVDKETRELLDHISDQLNRSLNLEQQFELSVPIIPLLLNYRVALGAGVDLHSVWKELKQSLKQ